MPKIRIRLVFCVIFKMPPNLIGSQYEKLIIQKLNVTLNIISDYPSTPICSGARTVKPISATPVTKPSAMRSA